VRAYVPGRPRNREAEIMGCFNSCNDIHNLCDECRAEFESLLDELHQDDAASEPDADEHGRGCDCDDCERSYGPRRGGE